MILLKFAVLISFLLFTGTSFAEGLSRCDVTLNPKPRVSAKQAIAVEDQIANLLDGKVVRLPKNLNPRQTEKSLILKWLANHDFTITVGWLAPDPADMIDGVAVKATGKIADLNSDFVTIKVGPDGKSMVLLADIETLQITRLH